MPWPKGRPRGSFSPEHREKIRQAMLKPRAAVPQEVEAWLVWVRRSWRKAFRPGKPPQNVSQATFRALAERLVLIGPPSDPEAQRVFDDLVMLLFSRTRLDWTKGQSLRKHLEVLPQTREELIQVAAAVEVVVEAEEELGPLAKQSFPVGNFIKVAQELADRSAIAAHVATCLTDSTRQFNTIAAIFHPRTVAYGKKSRIRGVVCGYVDHGEYMAQVRAAVRTVQ